MVKNLNSLFFILLLSSIKSLKPAGTSLKNITAEQISLNENTILRTAVSSAIWGNYLPKISTLVNADHDMNPFTNVHTLEIYAALYHNDYFQGAEKIWHRKDLDALENEVYQEMWDSHPPITHRAVAYLHSNWIKPKGYNTLTQRLIREWNRNIAHDKFRRPSPPRITLTPSVMKILPLN